VQNQGNESTPRNLIITLGEEKTLSSQEKGVRGSDAKREMKEWLKHPGNGAQGGGEEREEVEKVSSLGKKKPRGEGGRSAGELLLRLGKKSLRKKEAHGWEKNRPYTFKKVGKGVGGPKRGKSKKRARQPLPKQRKEKGSLAFDLHGGTGGAGFKKGKGRYSSGIKEVCSRKGGMSNLTPKKRRTGRGELEWVG